MESKVKKIVTGFGNCALRVPYAYAVLECGHAAKCKLQPSRGTCLRCGRELIQSETSCFFDPCQCGAHATRVTYFPDPSREEDRITKPGDTVECKECDHDAESLAWLEELDPTTVFRARFRMVVGRPTYHLYRRDPESPSGVMLIRGIPASPAFDAVLRRKGISPLSPTEDLRGAHGRIG